MKTYRGLRADEGCAVWVDGKPLPLHLKVRNHSPTGFEWGYEGSGPAQLALAILVDHLGDAEEAQKLYQRFKTRVIAKFNRSTWTLTSADIEIELAVLRARINATE